MVNRPDSSSTRSDKSSSSTRSSMIRNNNKKNVNAKSTFVRSKSGNDYNEKPTNKIRNASSLQSIAKTSGNQSLRGSGLRKFKSNGRSVQVFIYLAVDLWPVNCMLLVLFSLLTKHTTRTQVIDSVFITVFHLRLITLRSSIDFEIRLKIKALLTKSKVSVKFPR